MGKTLSTSSKRNGKIDLLKFFFAVSVAVYHFYGYTKFPHAIFNRGYLAVEFFFIVSGYYMSKTLSRIDAKNNADVIKESLLFIKKKYFSFFRYHVFVFILTVALWIPYLNLSIKQWLVKLITAIPNFFLLRMFGFNGSPWLMVEWYLSSMIIVMFLLAPIIIKQRKLYSCFIAPVISTALICFVYKKCSTLNVFEDKANVVWLCNLRAFAEISLGTVVYAVLESGVIEKFSRKLLLTAEAICYLATFTYLYKELDRTMELSILLILVVGVAISLSEKTSVAFLNNKFVYFLGKLSLAVYLCHTIVYHLFTKEQWADLGEKYSLALYLLMVTALSVICLFVSDGTSKLLAKRIKKGN